MQIKKLLATLVLLLGAVAYTPTVEAGASRCEGCTYTGARQKAKSLGLGNHVITSLSTDQVWGFEVYMYYEPGISIKMVKNWTLPQNILDTYDSARDVYVNTGGAMVVQIEVHIDDLNNNNLTGATVYDIVQNPVLQTQLGDSLGNSMTGVSWMDIMSANVQANLYAYLGVHDASITYVVTTTDDGEVTFQLVNGDATANYMEGESRTPGGDLVPEDDDDAAGGSWDDEPDNFVYLYDYLDGLGAIFEETGTGDVVESITCTWKESGGRMVLNCEVHFIPIP